MRPALAAALSLAGLASIASAQGGFDPIAVRALAVNAVHPSASAKTLLLVRDSANTTAQEEALARLLGSHARFVGDAVSTGDDQIALRAHVVKAGATDAVVQVDLWGRTPAQTGKEPFPYFSRYRVTLQKQGGAWVVTKTEPIFTS